METDVTQENAVHTFSASVQGCFSFYAALRRRTRGAYGWANLPNRTPRFSFPPFCSSRVAILYEEFPMRMKNDKYGGLGKAAGYLRV